MSHRRRCRARWQPVSIMAADQRTHNVDEAAPARFPAASRRMAAFGVNRYRPAVAFSSAHAAAGKSSSRVGAKDERRPRREHHWSHPQRARRP